MYRSPRQKFLQTFVVHFAVRIEEALINANIFAFFAKRKEIRQTCIQVIQYTAKRTKQWISVSTALCIACF